MIAVLAATIPVFGLVFCGYLGQRRKLLPPSAVEGLNAFVYYFALPCMLFRVVVGSPKAALFDWAFIATYVVGGMLMFWTVVLLTKRFHPQGDYNTGLPFGFASNAAHGNIGYLGLALTAEVLGTQFLPAFAVMILCDLFVVIGCTVVMLERRQVALQTALDHVRELGRVPSDEKRAALADIGSAAPSLFNVVWKVFAGFSRNPMIVALYVGLAFLLLDIPVPTVADRFMRLLGAAAAPCALFAIGASIGARAIKIDKSVFALLLAKLVVHPLLVALLAYWIFPVAEQKAAIAVLAASLPAASNTFILAQRYDVKTESIATAIVLGTAVSLLTVSYVIWILDLLPG